MREQHAGGATAEPVGSRHAVSDAELLAEVRRLGLSNGDVMALLLEGFGRPAPAGDDAVGPAAAGPQ